MSILSCRWWGENSCQHCHIWRPHLKLATVRCIVILLNPHSRNQAFLYILHKFHIKLYLNVAHTWFLVHATIPGKNKKSYTCNSHQFVFSCLLCFFGPTLSLLQEREYTAVCAHGKGIDKRYIGLIRAEMLMDLLINKFIRPSGSWRDKGNLSKRVKWELKRWANKLGHKLCLYGLKSASRATWIHILDYWFA